MASKGILAHSDLDLLFDEETHKLGSHVASLSQVYRTFQEYGNRVLPTPTKGKVEVSVQSVTSVLLNTWKEGSPEDQLQPKWKGPYRVTKYPQLQSSYRELLVGCICLE